MKVLITEEQLKLIINEQNDDVKLSKAEQQFLQNYIPIPREQIAAYQKLKSRAEGAGIKVRQKPFFKQYPFHTDKMKKLRDKGGKFTNDVQPYDFSELTSAAIAHNQSINRGEDKKWSKGEGKKYLKQKSDKYSKMTPERLNNSLNNDLEIEELSNLERLIDVIIDLKNMGVDIKEITGGDDYYHRYKGDLHPQGKAIDFTLSKSDPNIQKDLEEKIAVLITRHPDLAEHLSVINEYYKDTGGSGPHIHMGYKSNKEMSWFKWLTDKDGKNLRGNHKKINKKILENPKYSDFYKDVETNADTITTTVPPLGDVKIEGNNLKVNMGDEASQLAFQLFKKVGNKGEEIPYKKSNGNETVGGQTKDTYGANESKFFSLPSFISPSMMRTLSWTLLFVKVSRALDNLIVPSTTKQTEDFTIDSKGNIITGDELQKLIKPLENLELEDDINKNVEDYLDIERERILRDRDKTYVKPNTIPIELPKIEFEKD